MKRRWLVVAEHRDLFFDFNPGRTFTYHRWRWLARLDVANWRWSNSAPVPRLTFTFARIVGRVTEKRV